MNETATTETTESAAESPTTARTPTEIRELCLNAALAFRRSGRETSVQQRWLDILRNNANRDVLAICVNEDAPVIDSFVYAAFINVVQLLQAFFDVGMNIDAKNQRGSTALRSASSHGNKESVRWLLDHDAKVNDQDSEGMTSLMYVSQNEDTAIVEMLLLKNADPDIQDKRGRTALMHASSGGYQEIVQLLLQHNADIGLKSVGGKTALDLAKNEEIKELLLSHVSSSYVLK